jgi:hypothetical protein
MTIETDPLFVLIPEENAAADKLDNFIADALYRADIWDSWSASDGVEFCRVVERNPTRVRLSGRIWEISSQTVHTFWLDRVPLGRGLDSGFSSVKPRFPKAHSSACWQLSRSSAISNQL